MVTACSSDDDTKSPTLVQGSPDSGTSLTDGGSSPTNDSGSSTTDSGTDAGPTTACHVDGLTFRGGEYQVIAKGRLFTLDTSWNLTGVTTGTKLEDLAGFRDGPCVGQAAGACKVDSLSWRADITNYTVIRGAKFWTIDATYALVTPPGAEGAPLTVIPTIDTGPCAGLPAGTCSIQAFAFRNDSKEFYLIRDGKIWAFDNGGNFLGPSTGTPMTPVAGLAAMCAAAGPGCPVDDVTWRDDLQQWHYLSGGKFWATDLNVSSAAGSGTPLTSYAGLAQGPCAP